MARKILLVDDEPNILHGYRRQLRKEFEIETADGGQAGLDAIQSKGPYSVVVSDMRMPGVDGLQFLSRVQQISPDTVRIMLTGNADQKTATDAVNHGQIFRFLNKPCPPEHLAETLRQAQHQHNLLIAEKELLTKTLSGSVGLLTEILTLVNPLAFGCASSVRRLVHQICEEMHIKETWEVKIGAMLSHVGCVTVPETILNKVTSGIQLTAAEAAAYQGHPRVGHDLVSRIPRLETVAKTILYQQLLYDGSTSDGASPVGEAIPIGARILKVANDAAQLLTSGKTIDETREILDGREGWYDPDVLSALQSSAESNYVVKEVGIRDLTEEMILDEHVVSQAGEILLARGQEVTPALRERLVRFSKTVRGVQEPIRVRCPLRNQASSKDQHAPDQQAQPAATS